jgi:RNA polymerase sigma-70 factor (ECF subfamily)
MAADTLSRAFEAPAAEAPAAAREPRVVPPDIAAVYEAHFAYAHRCLRGLGVSDAALDDAVQDVFMVVQDKLERFDGGAQLRTWLYAIVLRVARRYRERAAIDARKFVAREPASDHKTLEAELEQGERLQLARRALSALDDDKREVFVLAQVEQMSAPEIAEILGVPVNTVYSRLRAARGAFNAHVARLQLGHARRSP